MAAANKSAATPSPGRAASLSVARLAAVQALYQMDVAQTDLNDVIDQFVRHRFSQNESLGLADADVALFSDIVRGVVRRQREIDPVLDSQLAAGWRLKRIDSIMRAILRAGAFELIERTQTPVAVIIDEYIDIAHAFFAGEEPKVVNGVLDKVAPRLRT